MTLSTPSTGHAPALPNVDRRSLLKGAAMLSVVPAVAPFAAGAFPAQIDTPDPLPGLLAQRRQAELVWLATKEGTPEEEAAWDEVKLFEELIETTVATSPEGVAAQIQYMKLSYGDPCLDPPPEEQCRVNDVPYAFLNVIVAGLVTVG